MNIDDVDTVDVPDQGRRFHVIFEKQQALMDKYDPIEKRNGANVPEPPHNLDDKFVQWRLKDLFWRVTEEIAESMECVMDVDTGWVERWMDVPSIRHFFEEQADALHFLVEASIIVGFKPSKVEAYWLGAKSASLMLEKKITPAATEAMCARIIWSLGLAANTLKNKPWKNTHMATDIEKFNLHLSEAWQRVLKLWAYLETSDEFVFELYAKKCQVNKFRQDTNY